MNNKWYNNINVKLNVIERYRKQKEKHEREKAKNSPSGKPIDTDRYLG